MSAMNFFRSAKNKKSRPAGRIAIDGPEVARAASIDSSKTAKIGPLENSARNYGGGGTVPNTIVIGIDFGTIFLWSAY